MSYVIGEQEPSVTLRPGSSADAELIMVSTGPFDAAQCEQVDGRGLRIYPPDETAALSGTTCSDAVGPLLTVSSVGTSITG